MLPFIDRDDAGRQLADRLTPLRGEPVVVLALPRGGVPVAAIVAAALDAPWDLLLVRKLGVPFEPELAMGAIGEEGVIVLDDDQVRRAGVTPAEVAAVVEQERAELQRRSALYRGGRVPLPLTGCTAVVVDDGVATGSTVRAACRVARARGASRVLVAVPVAPPGWQERLGGDADQAVALATPDRFFGVGQFYRDFRQISDDEVVTRLAAARAGSEPAPTTADLGP